jgi:serralysin
LVGGDGNDNITGNAGNDDLHGQNGNDTIAGGDGNDTITGGLGAENKLDGGAGEDVIYSSGDNDYIIAGSGADQIMLESSEVWAGGYAAENMAIGASIGSGEQVSLDGKIRYAQVLDAGSDRDTLVLQDTSDAFFLDDAFSGFHTENGSVSTARVIDLEAILAGNGDDIIDLTSSTFALSTNTEIYGEAGNDIIWAASGNDYLSGGEGNDSLFGASGNDILAGNLGADNFQFTASAGADRIVDFSLVEGDEIHLFYQTSAASDNTDLSLNAGVLTWNSGDVGQVVTIDLSDTFTSSVIGDLTNHIVFSEIV